MIDEYDDDLKTLSLIINFHIYIIKIVKLFLLNKKLFNLKWLFRMNISWHVSVE
jgi:hypothetical protein